MPAGAASAGGFRRAEAGNGAQGQNCCEKVLHVFSRVSAARAAPDPTAFDVPSCRTSELSCDLVRRPERGMKRALEHFRSVRLDLGDAPHYDSQNEAEIRMVRSAASASRADDRASGPGNHEAWDRATIPCVNSASPAMTGNARVSGRLAEQRGKTFFAGAGEVDDAAARRGIARRPVQFGEAAHHGGAQRAGEVMAAFAPVEAGLADRPARMRQRLGVDLQRLGHEALALAGEFDRLLGLPDQPLLAQAVEHLHAEIAGEMVVADPRPAQRRLLRPGAHAGMAGALGQAREAFEHMRRRRGR